MKWQRHRRERTLAVGTELLAEDNTFSAMMCIVKHSFSGFKCDVKVVQNSQKFAALSRHS